MKISFPIIAILVGGLILQSSCESKEERIQKKAIRIHENVLTVDSHTDTPLRFRRETFDIGQRNDPRQGGGKIDFPRMKEGGLDAAFFAVFLGQGPRTDEALEVVRNRTLTIFENVHNAVNKYPELAEIALTPDDAYRLKREGKRAIYIGLENGYPIGQDIEKIAEYYKLGARYITLSHTRNNDICDSSTDPTGYEHGGLSDFGREVVKEMNRIGMMIDVSHISDDAFFDVIKLSNAPVIASHSNARAICDNPRNLSDEMLEAIAKNGGVVQVCVLSSYVAIPTPNPARDSAQNALRIKYRNFEDLSDEESANATKEWYAIDDMFPMKLATVSELVDHIDHIVKVAGINHVGIGTDFDGGGGLADCFDVSEMGNITLELVKRGYKKKDIEKIWGGNFMRVFSKVEKLASK
jgi:membrane dipeptidase